MTDRKISILISFGASLAIAAIAVLLYFFLMPDKNLSTLSNAFLIPGAALVGIGGLMLIWRTGVFDVFAYSFYRLGESFKAGNQKRYDTAYDFQQAKKEKRKKKPMYVWPVLIVGAVCLLVCVILALVAFNQMKGAAA
ncbi:MAG: DUF3899 domain-containing protein [Bacilli bacterium]|nr:DUF3899 domain-containing protein [Bacilli bacterium]